MDRNHPKWDSKELKKYKNAIKNLYIKVDNAIGELIKEIPKETNIILVSDHGSGPLYGYFCINEWLKEKGYLKTKCRKRINSTKNLSAKLFISLRHYLLKKLNTRFLEEFLRFVPKKFLQRLTIWGQERSKYERLFDDIDWSGTKAYGLRMGIYINLKGRDPNGVIEPGEEYERLRNEIIQLLYQIRHPETGKKIITEVYKKEQIYSGKYIESAPDLIYVVDDMKYLPLEGLNYEKLFIRSSPFGVTGHHTLKGMFIAFGPDIRKTGKEFQNIRIYDITPTILHIFGIPVPEDMDGRVLKEIFEGDLTKKPVVYQQKKVAAERKEKAFSNAYEEQIKKRLQRLGYL